MKVYLVLYESLITGINVLGGTSESIYDRQEKIECIDNESRIEINEDLDESDNNSSIEADEIVTKTTSILSVETKTVLVEGE